jgi:hypothetical protein
MILRSTNLVIVCHRQNDRLKMIVFTTPKRTRFVPRKTITHGNPLHNIEHS